jgi:HK97 gp10 family phage protein
MAAPAGRSSGGWEAKVSWKNLTKVAYALKTGVAKEMGPATNRATRYLLRRVHERAYENLSGRMVNVRTGFLRSRLQTRQLNQYAGIVFNDAFYSVFIHDGTSRMYPRPFLTEAVHHVQSEVPGQLEQVLTECFKRTGLSP